MTREEIDRKKDIAAMVLLEKSGVGPMYAKAQLTPIYLDIVKDIGLAGSDNEAIVKVALQFAFSNQPAFREFIFKQSVMRSDWRQFRVRR